MPFASVASRLRRAGFLHGSVGLLLIASLLTACAEGFAPLTSAPAPAELNVSVVRPGSVRLIWTPVTATTGSVRSYIIERRVAITGSFVEVGRVSAVSTGDLQWFDTDVAPETIYGYRVMALTDLGDRSPPSIVGGVLTPPPPGIQIVTTSLVTSSESLDPDGYQVLISGPDTVRAVLSTTSTRRFSPLRPGAYTVTLTGVISRCAASAPSQQVMVTDTMATTITPVKFEVTCKDPKRGEFAVQTNLTGGDLDEGWSIDVLGQINDTTLPPAQRVFSAQRSQTTGAPSTQFLNLLPGTYTVTIRELAANCSLTGTAQRSVTVTPLSEATVTYDVTCVGAAPPPPPVSNAPFIWRNRWNPETAAPGASVLLEASLDLTARAGQAVKGVQASLRYDPAVLRFEEEDVGQLTQLILNSSSPGLLTFIASTPGNNPPRTGLVSVAKFRFTVIGAVGATSISGTSGLLASSPLPFQDSVQVSEDTLTVGTGGGGTVTNQPPVAQFTGPTTGTVGTALAFNGSGSSDPDGTIASYAWTFGDNTTAAIASPSKTYTTAGTYTVTLTVTDNRGATASRTSSVVISAGTTPPPPPPPSQTPVAEANGPYTTQVGVPITLSSAGSTNATSFSWALGNGQTATGASPTVTYATAGTFTVVLTATGANNAQSTDQATVTVTAAPPPPPNNATPLSWKNVVQPYDMANNLVEFRIVYDLGANLTETPGPEALQSFVVDSLKWDPALLQFVSINLGPGISGSSNQAGASSGRLGLRGTLTAGLNQGSNIVIANVRFRPVGAAGRTVTTSTFLGPLIGTSAVNFYSYNSKTAIVEGVFTIP